MIDERRGYSSPVRDEKVDLMSEDRIIFNVLMIFGHDIVEGRRLVDILLDYIAIDADSKV